MNPTSLLTVSQLSSRALCTAGRTTLCRHLCASNSKTLTYDTLQKRQRPVRRKCSYLPLTGCGAVSLADVPCRSMAGHSKWQNIKKIKEGKDKEKAKISSQMLGKIATVVKETGISDPKGSVVLARLIEQAKAQDVPNSSIESTLAKAKKSSNASQTLYIEGRGLAGSFFVIEVNTDKPTKTRNDLQGVVRKCGAEIGEMGCARHAFDFKGMIEVAVPAEEENVDMDKYVDIAIEAGAEDVTLDTDDVDEKVLTFLCEPDDIFAVKKGLEKQNVTLKSWSEGFLPSMKVSPQGKEMELTEKLMDRLENHPDVLRIFINVDAPDS